MSERNTRISIKVNDVEKKQIEALAEVYDCSQAAAARMLVTNTYDELFGSIHPEALERHDVSIDAIVRGELDPEDVDDALKMDSDGPAQVPAADGGSVARMAAASHSPTITPQELADSGPTLSWSELKDAIDRHWGPELEIHPDRVEPETLKNNRDLVSKILSGILRSESDVVVDMLIEDRIREYLTHQVTRHDTEAGLEYKIDQYKPLILERLEAHPGTRTESYYASPGAVERDLPTFVENTLESLHENQYVLDIESWAEYNKIDELTVGNLEQWLGEVADYRQDLIDLKQVRKDPMFIDMLMNSDEIDYPEEAYNDPIHWLKNATQGWKDEYTDVDPYARYAAVHTIRDVDDGLLEKDVDTSAEALEAFDGGDAPIAKQLALVRKAVL